MILYLDVGYWGWETNLTVFLQAQEKMHEKVSSAHLCTENGKKKLPCHFCIRIQYLLKNCRKRCNYDGNFTEYQFREPCIHLWFLTELLGAFDPGTWGVQDLIWSGAIFILSAVLYVNLYAQEISQGSGFYINFLPHLLLFCRFV